MWDQLKGFLVGLVISVILAEIFYLLVRRFPQSWWIVGWAAFMALFVLFVQIAPVVLFPIFYKFRPLENSELRSRLTRLSESAGTRVRGVYEWNLSEKSRKANAALTGWGATRRIILSDTLLANYTDDEIEAVLAHELGHHARRHILKSMMVQAVIAFAGFWALKWVLRWAVLRRAWFISQYDFANLPLIILVTTVISLALMPLLNAYSRVNEREADRFALAVDSRRRPVHQRHEQAGRTKPRRAQTFADRGNPLSLASADRQANCRRRSLDEIAGLTLPA